MHRHDRDRPLLRQRWGRRGVVAVLAAAAGFGLVGAGTGGHSSVSTPPADSSALMLTTAHTTVPDATTVQAATRVGQVVTAHRPTLTAAAVALLLPLVLLARRRPPIPVPDNARRLSHSSPPRRGPPTLFAR